MSADGFTVHEVVRRGASATVFRASHGDELVALKVYAASGDPTVLARARRERDALEAVAHPAVARLVRGGDTPGGGAYVATEWVAGPSLEQRLERGPPPWREAASILLDVGRGLRALHAAGIVHRDLKPSNIMLADDGAKLIDLGHSQLSSALALTATGTTVGSAAYMAPEQAADSAVDPRSDLYSAGVILYRTLTGVLPFEGRAPAIVMRMHQTEPVIPIEVRAPEMGFPRSMSQLCRWLLAKAPASRLPTAHVLVRTLEAILSEVPA